MAGNNERDADWADKENILQGIKHGRLELRVAPLNWKSDREVVLAAVKRDPEALEFASDDLKADEEIVLTAVSRQREAKRLPLEYFFAGPTNYRSF
eukprot:CAMPEP_0172392204 /NCGR_PEP_ID=MMETSP1061-20121228/8400_1 /TAXON_ID=37318 /ORGANISM="Pseudo-nitzschia pungens, Strain cf. pungens" /LENGTH=95 /DNA_ID=CAMNT_0013122997 /DNA_START=636 /DNA_END=920 /DNA_ORIENTATION=-